MCADCKEITIPIGPAGADGATPSIDVKDALGHTVTDITELRFLNKTTVVTDLGGGIATVENLPYKAEIKNYSTIVYNASTAETIIPSFTYTTPADGITRNYLLMFRTDIYSTLPPVLVALNIKNLTTSTVLAISTPESPDSSGTGSYVATAIHCYVSLAPGTSIAATFATPNILIGLKFPHLIILEQ